jgi:tRNA(Ile)-lysidine synthase
MLFLDWTRKNQLSVVLLGHTLDDNAETIMMKLIRGSGIDGLAGISKNKKINNLAICRPLLNTRREDLRQYLRFKNTSWIDEPSNFDERFKRIEVRNFLPQLSDIGLTANKLVALANHMTRAKDALNFEVLTFVKQYVQQKIWGDLEIKLNEFLKIPKEYQVRLLSAALRWISTKVYRPRFHSLDRLLNAIIDGRLGKGACLMGCVIKCEGEILKLSREFSAISSPTLVTEPKFVWDQKWQLEVDSKKLNIVMVGPLGKAGLRHIEKIKIINKITNVPNAALICSVAMFENDKPSCIPIICYGSGLTSKISGGPKSFLNFLLTY